MEKSKVIYVDKKRGFKITEVLDEGFDFEDLCGDCFSPQCNPEKSPKELEQGKKSFLKQVENDGVFGYVLEKWEPAVGEGWTHVDSCFGFVGPHETEKHCIVDEFLKQIVGGK